MENKIPWKIDFGKEDNQEFFFRLSKSSNLVLVDRGTSYLVWTFGVPKVAQDIIFLVEERGCLVFYTGAFENARLPTAIYYWHTLRIRRK